MHVRSVRLGTATDLVPLASVFEATRVVPELQATSKAGALRELVDAIRSAEGLEPAGIAQVCDRLLARERLGTTALGRGGAIPHVKWRGTRRFLGAIGYCPGGIDFDSLDGGPTYGVFLVVGPEDRPAAYLNLMTRLAQVIQKSDLIPFLTSCRNQQDFVDLLLEMDQ